MTDIKIKYIKLNILNSLEKLGLQVQDLKELIEIITWILVENSRLSVLELFLFRFCYNHNLYKYFFNY